MTPVLAAPDLGVHAKSGATHLVLHDSADSLYRGVSNPGRSRLLAGAVRYSPIPTPEHGKKRLVDRRLHSTVASPRFKIDLTSRFSSSSLYPFRPGSASAGEHPERAGPRRQVGRVPSTTLATRIAAFFT